MDSCEPLLSKSTDILETNHLSSSQLQFDTEAFGTLFESLRNNSHLIRHRLEEIGIVIDGEGRVIAANEKSKASRVFARLLQNWRAEMKFEKEEGPYGGGFDLETKELTVGYSSLVQLVFSQGTYVPSALLHEVHHFRQDLKTAARSIIQQGYLLMPLGNTDSYRKFPHISSDYTYGYGFDEILAYRKDVKKLRSTAPSNGDRPDLLKTRTLELLEFSQMTGEIAIELRKILSQEDSQILFRSEKGKSVFKFLVSRNEKRESYELRFKSGYLNEFEEPRQALQQIVNELESLSRLGIECDEISNSSLNRGG